MMDMTSPSYFLMNGRHLTHIGRDPVVLRDQYVEENRNTSPLDHFPHQNKFFTTF